MDEQNSTSPLYLTPTEASEILRLTTATLAGFRSHKTGPTYIRYPSGAIRYRLADLTTWAESHGPQDPKISKRTRKSA